VPIHGTIVPSTVDGRSGATSSSSAAAREESEGIVHLRTGGALLAVAYLRALCKLEMLLVEEVWVLGAA
jgi:hypothetical protein